MFRTGIAALALTAALISSQAFAQQIQKSDEIVKYFAGKAQLGASRGICVGTEDECKSKQAKVDAEVQQGLDMYINFDLNSADLLPDAKTKLTEFASALKDNRLKSLDFAVEGYTDATGSPAYNEKLSARRAESVASFLMASGIETSRLNAVGMGEKNPRGKDPYDPINRRVEMRIKQ